VLVHHKRPWSIFKRIYRRDVYQDQFWPEATWRELTCGNQIMIWNLFIIYRFQAWLNLTYKTTL